MRKLDELTDFFGRLGVAAIYGCGNNTILVIIPLCQILGPFGPLFVI